MEQEEEGGREGGEINAERALIEISQSTQNRFDASDTFSKLAPRNGKRDT